MSPKHIASPPRTNKTAPPLEGVILGSAGKEINHCTHTGIPIGLRPENARDFRG